MRHFRYYSREAVVSVADNDTDLLITNELLACKAVKPGIPSAELARGAEMPVRAKTEATIFS